LLQLRNFKFDILKFFILLFILDFKALFSQI
jgi:hypothetical protein